MQLFWTLSLFIGVAWVVRLAMFPKPEVRVVASADGLISQQGLSKKSEQDLAAFFVNDLQLESRVVVLGRRDSAGNMRFQMQGDLDAGAEQQIRNVLHTMVMSKPARDCSQNRCG